MTREKKKFKHSLGDLGGDGPARSTPCGEKVDEDELVGLEGVLEILGVGKVVDSHFCGGRSESSGGCC